MDGVTPQGSALALLADLIAGKLAAATLHLFVNDITPNRFTAVADLTEATFTGGAAKTLGTWGEPFVTDAGEAAAFPPSVQWNWSAGDEEIVYGVYLLSAGVGTPLLGLARLETPAVMGSVEASLALALGFILGTNKGRLTVTQISA